MSSNFSIIIYKSEQREYYVIHIFRDILYGTYNIFNRVIGINNYDWYTGSEVPA